MQENSLTKYTMTYGLYLGVAFSVVVLGLKLIGGIHHPGDFVGIVNAGLLSLGIFVFGKKYRHSVFQGHFIFKNAFGFGVLLTLFAAIIFSFFSYWYYSLLEPTGIQYYIDQMRLAYVENQSFNEEQINALISVYQNTFTPSIMAFVVFLSQMLIGVLISLVMAVFIKMPNLPNNNM